MNWKRIKWGVLLTLSFLILIEELHDQVQNHESLHFSSRLVSTILLILVVVFSRPDFKKPN